MAAKDLFREYRQIINPPYQANDLIIVFLTLLILISIPFTTFAVMQSKQPTIKAAGGTATLYLSPATKTLNQGEAFAVQIRENSSLETVNAVQANLSYDATKFDFVSIDATGSAFDLQFENTGGAGLVKIARSSTTAKSGDQLVATVNFTAKASPGVTQIIFAAGSAVVSSTDNTNTLGTTTPGTYTIGDPPPTVTITSPTAGDVLSGTANVTATATDNIGVTKVEFYVGTQLRSTDTSSPYEYGWNTTADPDGSYILAAKAFDTAGSSSNDSVTVTVNNTDTQSPSAPTGLTAQAAAYNRVDLSWTASSDNKAVAGYYIIRNNVTVDSSQATSYADTSVQPSTTYSYQVRAFDAAGNISNPSNTATATTPVAPDTQSPTPPSNLTAVAVSSSQVNLSWNASSDNIGVTGYDVYRNNSASPIASVTTTSLGDAGLSPSTAYSYHVKAKDAAKNVSSPSNTAAATTLAPPPDGVLAGSVKDTASGSVLVGVIIKVNIFGMKGKNALVTTATTNSSGVYAVTLKQGSYTVVANSKGYGSQSQNTTIQSGITKILDFLLSRKGGGKR